MTERCLVCLESGDVPEAGVHGNCARRLFGTRTIPEIEVDPANLHLLGLSMAGRVTLSGVQRKLSLGRERKTLRVVTEHSAFILKPDVAEYPCLPANEHLTMRLADLVGLETPAFGLVRLRDGALALLVRRFDRTDSGGKLPMEDFCQLTGRAPSEKYQGSAEACVKILNRHSSAPIVDALTLFRQLLFSWWVGNDDLHLKNVSLLSTVPGSPKLSPVYDLVNTSIVIPDAEMAMTMGGKRRRFDATDWLGFARHARLPPEIVAEEAEGILAAAKPAIELVRRSFLRDDLKRAYARGIVERHSGILALRNEARSESTRVASSRAEPRAVSSDQCARTVLMLRRAFEEEDLSLGGSEIERDLGELEWLGGEERSPFDLYREEPARAGDALVKLVRYDRLRKALDRAASFPGYSDLVKHLRKLRLPKSGRGDSQAWNHLFEVECAAQLSQPFWRPEFREPDIVLRCEDAIGIACKRPRGVKTIARNVADGCAQIQRAGLPGFVAVSLDLALDSALLAVDHVGNVRAAAREALERVVGEIRADVATVLPPCEADVAAQDGVLGVIFCATFLTAAGWSEELAYLNTHFESTWVVNPAVPELEGTLEFFANVLSVGQAELRQQP